MYADNNVDYIEDEYTGLISKSNIYLEVLGNNGLKKQEKRLIVRCSICAKDPELYGDGIFNIHVSAFNSGRVPCGCSPIHIKNESQRIVLASRILQDKGFKFLGWEGGYKGINSSYRGYCEEHGEFVGKFSPLLAFKNGCQMCGWQSRSPTEKKISEFKASGGFDENCEFWRSTKKNKAGFRVYWFVYCPICDGTYEVVGSTLTKGSSPCLCGKNRQTKAYIMLFSEGSTQIALKFGISSVPERRLEQQKKSSKFLSVNLLGIWEFETKKDCWNAESICKETLLCGVLTKNELHEGFTETVSVLDYDKIVEIYESNGGKRREF